MVYSGESLTANIKSTLPRNTSAFGPPRPQAKPLPTFSLRRSATRKRAGSFAANAKRTGSGTERASGVTPAGAGHPISESIARKVSDAKRQLGKLAIQIDYENRKPDELGCIGASRSRCIA